MNESMGITGKLTIQVTRDGKVIEEREVKNLITTAGKGLIATIISAGSGTTFTHMGIGTGDTAATVNDTALESSTGRVAVTSKTVTNNKITYVGDFPAGTGTGTIVEAGVFNASTAGTMLNRAVFSPISKTAADALKISWEVTFG